jgi:hypothetical protein
MTDYRVLAFSGQRHDRLPRACIAWTVPRPITVCLHFQDSATTGYRVLALPGRCHDRLPRAFIFGTMP